MKLGEIQLLSNKKDTDIQSKDLELKIPQDTLVIQRTSIENMIPDKQLLSMEEDDFRYMKKPVSTKSSKSFEAQQSYELDSSDVSQKYKAKMNEGKYFCYECGYN